MEIEAARQILLDHAKHPRNKLSFEIGADEKSQYLFGECRNPICGDHVRVFVQLRNIDLSEPVAEQIHLEFKGCTICTASASLMSEAVKGLSFSRIHSLRALFEGSLLESENALWNAELSALEAFKHLRVNPARIPCSLIGWYALKQAIAAGKKSIPLSAEL